MSITMSGVCVIGPTELQASEISKEDVICYLKSVRETFLLKEFSHEQEKEWECDEYTAESISEMDDEEIEKFYDYVIGLWNDNDGVNVGFRYFMVGEKGFRVLYCMEESHGGEPSGDEFFVLHLLATTRLGDIFGVF